MCVRFFGLLHHHLLLLLVARLCLFIFSHFTRERGRLLSLYFRVLFMNIYFPPFLSVSKKSKWTAERVFSFSIWPSDCNKFALTVSHTYTNIVSLYLLSFFFAFLFVLLIFRWNQKIGGIRNDVQYVYCTRQFSIRIDRTLMVWKPLWISHECYYWWATATRLNYWRTAFSSTFKIEEEEIEDKISFWD